MPSAVGVSETGAVSAFGAIGLAGMGSTEGLETGSGVFSFMASFISVFGVGASGAETTGVVAGGVIVRGGSGATGTDDSVKRPCASASSNVSNRFKRPSNVRASRRRQRRRIAISAFMRGALLCFVSESEAERLSKRASRYAGESDAASAKSAGFSVP